MLKIINQRGQILNLEDDVSIPVERNNMLFNKTDSLFQDVVYTFNAGLTAENKLFIKNGHLVDAQNGVYQIEVQVYLKSEILFSGILVYSIKSNKIQITIKPNFASAAAKAVDSRINQIDFADQLEEIPSQDLAVLMKNTCQNPDDYGYIFVPIWNTRIGEDSAPTNGKNDYINQFDSLTNTFKVEGYSAVYPPIFDSENTPFLKLIFVLSKIAKVLGYENITGEWQNSDEAKKTYIHNIRNLTNQVVYTLDQPVLTYDQYPFGLMLPNLTISEFLKAVRERFNLSFDFDNTKSEFKIESFDSALKQPEIELLDFIEEVAEINGALKKGYQISLKVDELDRSWNSGTEEEPLFIPNYDLLIGDSKEKIELAAGTLRTHQEGLYKSVASELTFREIIGENTEYNDQNNFQIKFFKYDGFLEIEPGKFWPQTSNLDIDLKSAKFYNFLNSAKQFKLVSNIPNNILTKITGTSTINFKSKEGTYVSAIIEKIGNDIKNKQEYIKTEITCRSLNFQEKSKAILRDNFAIIGQTTYKVLSYKSNFENLLPTIVVSDLAGSSYIVLNTSKNTTPCDKYGVGGQDQICYKPSEASTSLYFNITFEITQGIPKYVSFLAKKAYFFQQLNGNYVASMPYRDSLLNGLSYFIRY